MRLFTLLVESLGQVEEATMPVAAMRAALPLLLGALAQQAAGSRPCDAPIHEGDTRTAACYGWCSPIEREHCSWCKVSARSHACTADMIAYVWNLVRSALAVRGVPLTLRPLPLESPLRAATASRQRVVLAIQTT